MSKNDTQEKLRELSHSLAKIHKSLLNFQKEIHERLDEKRLSPYDLLHLSLNDPDFDWLRKLSRLMVIIDDGADQEEADQSSAALHEAKKELRSLFIEDGKHEDFKNRVERASIKHPEICLQLADLKKRI